MSNKKWSDDILAGWSDFWGDLQNKAKENSSGWVWKTGTNVEELDRYANQVKDAVLEELERRDDIADATALSRTIMVSNRRRSDISEHLQDDGARGIVVS